jgi:hypothetical protein
MVIKRIGPLSCAKITGVIYAILGIVVGAAFSLASITGTVTTGASEDAPTRAAMGIAAIVALPIVYGGLGFCVTFIFAWLYNALVDVVGGIEIELQ